MNRLEDKNLMIIYLDTEKAFDIFQHPFMIKLLERTGIQGTFLNKIKAIYSKFIAKINPNREKLKATELKKSSQITQPAEEPLKKCSTSLVPGKCKSKQLKDLILHRQNGQINKTNGSSCW